jgi:tetratricopeptide (TPR) repeat protein
MWLGWLFLLAGIYLLIVVLRGGLGILGLFFGDSAARPSRGKPGGKGSAGDAHAPGTALVSAAAAAEKKGPKNQKPVRKPRAALSSADIQRAQYRSGGPGLFHRLFAHKTFDYYVAAALADEDLRRKVEHCAKALKLNPGYVPAWGLKANTLLELGEYTAALECFERILELDPNPIAWYKKGLCFRCLNRWDEAIECFQQAMQTCSNDRQLFQDASREKQLVEELRNNSGTP